MKSLATKEDPIWHESELIRLLADEQTRAAHELQVGPGRTVLRAGDRLTSIVIGLQGIVLVKGPRGELTSCAAPFVLGCWAADRNGTARIEAVTQSDAVLLLVNASDHHRFHNNAPLTRHVSTSTRAKVLTDLADTAANSRSGGGAVSQHISRTS